MRISTNMFWKGMISMVSMNKWRPELKGSYLVVFILAKIVDREFGSKIVPYNNPGKQPSHPYVTYHPISPHDYTTFDHRPDQYYVRMQLDVHTSDPIMASDMAAQLLEALTNSQGYRNWFDQVNVVPTPLPNNKTKIQDHTTLPGINYDNAYGFYFDFLISRADLVYEEKDLKFDFEENTIESIRANSEVDGDHIDAKKKEEN